MALPAFTAAGAWVTDKLSACACTGMCGRERGYEPINDPLGSPTTIATVGDATDYADFYSAESKSLLADTEAKAKEEEEQAPAAAAAAAAAASAPPAAAAAPTAVEPAAAAPAPEPELVAATSVAMGEKVSVLALEKCEAAVLGAGMKFNAPRKKRCGTKGVVASIDGEKIKVKFSDVIKDPDSGEVLRTDTAQLLFPVGALANAPSVAFIKQRREGSAAAPRPLSKEQHEEHMKEHYADCGKALGGDAASRLEGHLTAHRAKLTEGLSGGGGGPLATPDILAI